MCVVTFCGFRNVPLEVRITTSGRIDGGSTELPTSKRNAELAEIGCKHFSVFSLSSVCSSRLSSGSAALESVDRQVGVYNGLDLFRFAHECRPVTSLQEGRVTRAPAGAGKLGPRARPDGPRWMGISSPQTAAIGASNP